MTYERADLPDVNPLSGNQDLVAVGLMGRKWLDELSGDAAIKADITYLIRPVLNALLEAIRHASMLSASVAHIAEAHSRVVALTNRLRRAQLPPPDTSPRI
ncbi:hypothetical protein [Ktedonobacter robiniae]|uniref:Uncharacterized protein n=1 Tax=Ktedonobacter robiniae TaxID=2778365 RepID=A0ABQ3UTE7_9CHLR|nr:hypothetical protein [Ktedonobacter robiniae]GHO56036.1 hypothetical protein KSB_45110 [Ktedonobacter robiniae]